ncbi:HAD family hydrolase [Phormidium sp. FACHB-1136]|uniref:HAD family hydrolase n=1 Tax=Phormidium sp. FACHB-1136 TaxID=2692848 RepID=UPI001685D706|nr:HAD family hydrolase [Phormidium sp. FACHB-1136]MBD2426675.1 HAD family phosphatase [Phormidium sp. FACHB-1136]
MDKFQPCTVAEFVHQFQQTCPQPGLMATDMDGTLTRQGKFSADLIQALDQLQREGWTVLVVTGRSAGWVQGLAHYLPIAGAMAENGGVYFPGSDRPEYLSDIPNLASHRESLEEVFRHLGKHGFDLTPAEDNTFRLTDWTFSTEGLTSTDLTRMAEICHGLDWGFTYSTVQCHLFPQGQSKAAGLQRVLKRHFPQFSPQQVITLGDSPNDVSLFDAALFPHSVGVANVKHYWPHLAHHPRCVTHRPEVDGFLELIQALLA